MWNDVRKSYRSPQKTNNGPRLSTTCLITPAKGQKPTVRHSARQCPLHFSEPSHICLTCRKSICLRCALTYCQDHVIRNECQAIVQLREEVLRLQITPKIEQLQIKLQQSQERQEYLQKKILRLIQSIQNHFDYISEVLNKKKLQIIEFYDQEFQRYLQQHRNYDNDIKERMDWLKKYAFSEQIYKISTIEEIDFLSTDIKRADQEDSKIEKKITKMLMGKDKIRIEKLWSQQNLQKILYEIEHIPFKLEEKVKGEKGKKRVTTQNAMEMSHNNIKVIKSSHNSRFSSGRKAPAG